METQSQHACGPIGLEQAKSDGLCECGCGKKAPISPETNRRYGWIKGKPKRYINGHSRRKSPVEYVEEDRGWHTPCWIWQKAMQSRGYGMAWTNGRWITAHRYMYEKLVGPIPEGLHLDHECEVKCCVNPNHCRPVSPARNIQKGKGAKLTPALVYEIRDSKLSSRELGRRLGVSHTVVNDVRRGRAWRTV